MILEIIKSVSLEFVRLRHWTKLVDAYTPSGMKSTNVTRVSHLVSLQDRCLRQGHLGGVLWFTGLPASGKKTITFQLERRLFEAGYEVFAFDSTWQRKGLSSDLGFSREDRRENIRRAGELAATMARSGLIAISAFVSPYSRDRAVARATAGENFHVESTAQAGTTLRCGTTEASLGGSCGFDRRPGRGPSSRRALSFAI